MISKAELIEVNRLYREKDDSHLWPIKGRFNVTERAIRKARWFRSEAGECSSRIEYEYLLDGIISEIVNDERNW